MFRLVALVMVLGGAQPAWAADAETRAKTIAPFVDERTVAVGYADLTRVDVAAVARWIGDVGKMPAKEMARTSEEVRERLAQLTRAGAREAYLVASLDDLPSQPPFLVLPLVDGADGTGLVNALKHLGGLEVVEQRGQAVVAGNSASMRRLTGIKPKAVPELARAFAAAGDVPVQGVFLFASDLRRSLDETFPNLPPELGGASTTIITRGVRWAAVGVDLAPKASIHLVVKSVDPAAAKGLHDWLAGLPEQPMFKEFLPELVHLAPRLMPETVGDELKITVDPKTMVDLAQPALAKARRASQNAGHANQLKQLGLAMYSSYDVNKVLPAWSCTTSSRRRRS